MSSDELPTDPTPSPEPGAQDEAPTTHEHPEVFPPEEPSALVARMVAVDQWPEPAIFERVLAAGDAAVLPLLDVLRHPPDDDFSHMSVFHAIGLLGMLHVEQAVPLMVEVARKTWSEASGKASDTAAAFGAVAVPPLLDAVADPEMRGYRRLSLLESAFTAARDDAALHARVSEFAVDLFKQIVAESKSGAALEGELIAESDRAADVDDSHDIHGDTIEEIDDLDNLEELVAEFGDEDPLGGEGPQTRENQEREEELWNELISDEELAHLAEELLTHVGESTLPLIESAFDDELIDTSILSRDDLKRPIPKVHVAPLDSWLDDYRRAYEEHLAYKARVAARSLESQSWKSFAARSAPAPTPPRPKIEPTAPIWNTGPKVGRNDPCWCGSGKKYKKCHMSKDSPE